MVEPAGSAEEYHDLPRVSVIVPVRDRRDLLGNLLDALEGQTYPDFEVVVVDDGSTDGSAAVAEGRLLGRDAILVVQAGGVGAVDARCLGVARARGRIFAFTDSDCLPSPDWLERGVHAIDSGADVVAGSTRPPRPLRPLERSVASGEEGLFPTCNLFVRRESYEAVGGFDRAAAKRLGFRWSNRARGLGFGEDTLMAWSICRAGGTAAYAPDALVEHHIFQGRLSELPGRALQAGAFPALLREVPELRTSLLRWGFLGSARRLPFYLSAVALGAGHRRPAFLIALAWCLVRARSVRMAPVSLSDKVRAVVGEMALDALTGAVLLAGSCRSRTLVL